MTVTGIPQTVGELFAAALAAEAMGRDFYRQMSKAFQQPADPIKQRQVYGLDGILTADRIGGIQNLDDAYELAHEFENSEINRLFASFASSYVFSPETKEFLLSEILDHQAKLLTFAESFGGHGAMRAVPIKARIDP